MAIFQLATNRSNKIKCSGNLWGNGKKSYNNNNLDDGNKGTKNETWHRHESLS